MKCNDKSFAALAKNKITLQSKSNTTDDYGGQASTWSDAFTAWAWVKPLGIFERTVSEAHNSEVTHKITIRYNSNYADTASLVGYRIKLDNRFFSVEGIKLLDLDFKNYGKAYIEILARQNAPEYA